MKKTLKTICAVLSILFLFPAAANQASCADYSSLALGKEDLELIARAVRAEVPDESLLTKACVASMIMNRLKDEVLPDDVRTTVYEKGAFLFADRDAIDAVIPDGELEECVVLTKLVYKMGIDPTCGAIFCFDENDDSYRGLEVTIKLDGLVFAKPPYE